MMMSGKQTVTSCLCGEAHLEDIEPDRGCRVDAGVCEDGVALGAQVVTQLQGQGAACGGKWERARWLHTKRWVAER